jgi:phosphate ABC transporter phosphate-binding protein
MPRRFRQLRIVDIATFHRRSVFLGCVAVLAGLTLLHPAQAQTAVSLNRVRTIYVSSMGEGSSAGVLRQHIADRLGRSGRLTVVDSASQADVTLRGTSSIWATGAISLSPRSNGASQTIYEGYLAVEVVGKNDRILWSYLVTPSRFRTSSIIDDLVGQIVARLENAIEHGAANPAGIAATASPESQVPLHAAGSTLAAPLYRKWIQSMGAPVAYDAIGSEAGIEQMAEGKVDFAASDMPLDSRNTPAGLQVLHFPTVIGGVVPIYNLPSLGRTLRLTPQVLAGIYSGAIRRWNDPRIAEINHRAALPDADIAVAHRSDGSGTTFVWTSFLSQASAEWKTNAGSGPRVSWPVGAGAAGNEGVADLVQKKPNSIGYVELIYAIQHELNYAAVRNPAGQFIKADLASITVAASGATVKKGDDFRFSILNSANREAYPISTFTWLLVPAEGLSPEKRSAIADLIEWALTSGQKQCASLGYAPLPREIANSELEAVKAWKSRE